MSLYLRTPFSANTHFDSSMEKSWFPDCTVDAFPSTAYCFLLLVSTVDISPSRSPNTTQSYLLNFSPKESITEEGDGTRNNHAGAVAGLEGRHEYILLAEEFGGTSLAINTTREGRARGGEDAVVKGTVADVLANSAEEHWSYLLISKEERYAKVKKIFGGCYIQKEKKWKMKKRNRKKRRGGDREQKNYGYEHS